jgi:hypothetical protein
MVSPAVEASKRDWGLAPEIHIGRADFEIAGTRMVFHNSLPGVSFAARPSD